MIAIFENRGKQYKAKIGDFLKLPKLVNLKKMIPLLLIK